MNKEELVRETQGKKIYQSPSLSVYGRVSQLTSSGSGTSSEGVKGREESSDSKEIAVRSYRA